MCPATATAVKQDPEMAASGKDSMQTVSESNAIDNENNDDDDDDIDKKPSLNIETCTPETLAEFLLKQRFHKDESKTQSFLQATTKAVSKFTSTMNSVESLPTIDLGAQILLEPLETSLIVPRAGKFHIQFHPSGLLATKLNDKSITFFVPSDRVSHVILFAKPEDIKTICNVTKSKKPKPPNAHLVLLQLSSPMPFPNNKEIHQLCFALSWNKADGPTGPKLVDSTEPTNNNDDTTETTATNTPAWQSATFAWRKVLEQSFPNAIWSQVQPTVTKNNTGLQQPRQVFRSYSDPGQSTTTGNMPFVKCYHGVQDGVLYPLEEGLLFYKPPKFIPRGKLHSIACGRGGQNASRYVDMHLVLNSDDDNNDNNNDIPVEFTNIQREEIGVLNEYIQTILIPAMKRDVKNQQKQNSNTHSNDDEDTEEEDEDDDNNNRQTKQNDDNEETDEEDDSDDEDENFVDVGSEQEGDDDNNDDDTDDSSDDDDDDDEVEIVQDDFAQELAKRKQDDSSATESESEEVSSRQKRRRRSSS